jgi:hypothetical protein
MPDTRHQFEKGEPVNPYKKIYRNCLARAIEEADLNTAMEMEANHYGDKFTRFDQAFSGSEVFSPALSTHNVAIRIRKCTATT